MPSREQDAKTFVDLETFRRGLHVGDRVRVTFNIRNGESVRLGTICGWSWHGRNFSDADTLPDLDLRADVSFEKLDGSGSYRRTFGVEDLKPVAATAARVSS